MRMIGKWVMAPIRATAGRVSLQITGRALISLKVNGANAMCASFDPCLPAPAGFCGVSPDRDRDIWDGCLQMRATTRAAALRRVAVHVFQPAVRECEDGRHVHSSADHLDIGTRFSFTSRFHSGLEFAERGDP